MATQVGTVTAAENRRRKADLESKLNSWPSPAGKKNFKSTIWLTLSFAKNRSEQKPCSIRALAIEMNRLTGGLRLLADNHVTQRYMPAHPASVVLENRSLSMWKRES